MLRRLPVVDASPAEDECDETGVDGLVAEALESSGALTSPLAFFVLELDGGELRLLRTEPAVSGVDGGRTTRELARFVRTGSDRYAVRRR